MNLQEKSFLFHSRNRDYFPFCFFFLLLLFFFHLLHARNACHFNEGIVNISINFDFKLFPLPLSLSFSLIIKTCQRLRVGIFIFLDTAQILFNYSNTGFFFLVFLDSQFVKVKLFYPTKVLQRSFGAKKKNLLRSENSCIMNIQSNFYLFFFFSG